MITIVTGTLISDPERAADLRLDHLAAAKAVEKRTGKNLCTSTDVGTEGRLSLPSTVTSVTDNHGKIRCPSGLLWLKPIVFPKALLNLQVFLLTTGLKEPPGCQKSQ